MPPALPIGFALVAVAALSAMVARHLRLPHSILLVLVGGALAFAPGMPHVALDPDLMLLLFLPPLIYSSGVGMSWRGFRANLRPILLLAVGCVLFTATVVAAVAHWAFGLPWAAGFVLGAVVSPPDPVAPMAIARRLSVPQQPLTILEGEGLVNDATALILLSFAVAAAGSGGISIPAAAMGFAATVAGETLWGAGVGWVTLHLRRLMRDPQVEIVLALLTPFLAFWPPHVLGGSGVIATVAAGLCVSWNGPRYIAPATRLQGYFAWSLVVHLIEGVIFLLTGLQAHAVVTGAAAEGWRRLLLAGAVTSLVVVAVRFAWVFPAAYLPRLLSTAARDRKPAPSWHVPFLVGFTGIRGAVSLIAALSIPLTTAGGPFPGRDLILFATFCVIVVTLVGQGSALPWVIARLGLDGAGKAEAAENKRREVAARIAGVEAALTRLDDLERTAGVPAPAVEALRRRHCDRLAQYAGTADDRVMGSPVADDAALQLQLVEAERRALADRYAAGGLTDEARRRIEREFDLEDARVRHAAESATGDRLDDDPDAVLADAGMTEPAGAG